jgi:hypothetical protein
MNLQVGLVLLVTTACYVGVGIAVGIRLVRLARRTRGFPERMLGWSALVGPGLVAPSMVVVHAISEPEVVVRAAAATSQLAYAAFCALLVTFTWQCFRPDDSWARWLARGAMATAAFGAAVGVARALGFASAMDLRDMNHWAFRLMGFAVLVGNFWTAAESFGYYGRMRKRRVLGLADPVVTNRFLLWGLVGAGAVAATGVPMVVSLAGGDSFNDVPTRLVGAAATIFGTVCLQLAFLPPRSYVNWLQKRALVS